MDGLENIAGLLIAIAIWIIQAVAAAKKRREGEVPAPAPRPQRAPRPAPAPLPRVPAPTGASSPRRPPPASADAVVARLRDLAGQLRARSDELAATAELRSPTRRFAPTLRVWVPGTLGAAERALGSGPSGIITARDHLVSASIVVDAVERMIADRQAGPLMAALGDADALASACYAPILTSARAEGWRLTAAEPATLFGPYDLSIATGFAPAGILPIFLPDDFFQRVAWWPALAHEMGHGLLASLPGLDRSLRQQLGLPSEDAGRLPLDVSDGTLAPSEIERIFGGWLEEVFSDVFGTLMCGPAYVITMSELFAASGDPREVLAVGRDEDGYDVHPPRHLRLAIACSVLDRMGLGDLARKLRQAWDERHALAGEAPDRLLFPHAGAFLAVPLAPIEAVGARLAETLVEGPIHALSSSGLRDISGLDYGPHEHAGSLRTRDALLGGHALDARDPRTIIAGAVLAAAERPGAEARILAAARRAIPGHESFETAPSPYDLAPAKGQPAPPRTAAEAARAAVAARSAQPLGAATSRRALFREAMITRAIFEPPRALRR